ncbi:roadblock/LC7 domain-containing protein [uncultured Desulfuromusa sp.]|uniref:roadblock/LC7 domain-containing protein n=1 Tax=uncultured Desulfuromusa sp. TaxID=219183 RepID=UPI002AA70D5C|nr:roadblock/LC7 domain-containing protein [uncultured Desulfuromusa sp.]
MIHLIDELKVIPGVIGACIVSSKDGLKVGNLPSIFKAERLSAVGRHLLKLYSAGRLSFDDLTDLTLNYDESVVVARELEKGTLVFAICDPTFNQNLLTMSLNLLHEEYKLGNFSEATAPAGTNDTTESAASESAAEKKVSVALQELFAEMKGALGKILGPMAGFVFDEVVEEWMKQGAPEFARIDSLIEQVNQEISEQSKIDSYHELIDPLLKGFQKG